MWKLKNFAKYSIVFGLVPFIFGSSSKLHQVLSIIVFEIAKEWAFNGGEMRQRLLNPDTRRMLENVDNINWDMIAMAEANSTKL